MNSTVTALESFRLLGSTISQDLKWDTHFLHLLRKLNLPQELLKQSNCHHWIRPLHVNNCVVQLNYQIWPQKTTDSCQDCWENHWYKPPHSPRTVLIQSEQTAGKITLDPSHSALSLFELLPSCRRYRALSTRMARHRNSFFPQAIHLMNMWQ